MSVPCHRRQLWKIHRTLHSRQIDRSHQPQQTDHAQRHLIQTLTLKKLLRLTLGCLLTYLITPWSRVLLEKLTGSAASQEIPRIFGTRRFITLLTSARHLSLSWANSIQSPQPPPTLILYSHLRLGLPSGLFPSGFPTRTLYTPLP